MWPCRKRQCGSIGRPEKVNGGQINSLQGKKQHIKLHGIQEGLGILTVESE